MSESIGAKVAYVRRQRQIAPHHCHWPGCTKSVPPAKWGCLPHWNALPEELRTKIWKSFTPGQEISKTPSKAYVQASREVQNWIAAQAGTAKTAASPEMATQLSLESL